MRTMCFGLWLSAAGVFAQAAEFPDYEREKRLAAEVEDTIIEGEPLYLEADGDEFLAIMTEGETDAPDTGVIVLHGRGNHPNWADVAYPLRTGLAARGYSTLSLQMPVLPKGTKYYDYVPIFPFAHPRIRAGIAYLKQQGLARIVLAAHSCGAHMAMSYIREFGDGELAAYIGIGMGATDYKQPMRRPFPLRAMLVPVLDVYGEHEYPAVIRLAPGRLAAMRTAGNPASRQIVVPDADHYFKDRGEPLTEVVADWLDALPR